MRIFINKAFARFARKAKLDDAALCKAIALAESGLVDADLGGSVIKQRIARHGQGKSGSFRALIAYRRGKRAVFIYGFAKSERPNVTPLELAALKALALELLAYHDRAMDAAIAAAALTEVRCDG
jgi:hypothetical protein